MEPGGSGLVVHPSCASKIRGAWLEAGWCSGSANIGIGIDIDIWGSIWLRTLGEAVCSVLVFSTRCLEEVAHGTTLCLSSLPWLRVPTAGAYTKTHLKEIYPPSLVCFEV